MAPATKADAVLMGGRKYTYSLNIPETLTGKVKGASTFVTINTPGTFNFAAHITDSYGVTQAYTYRANIVAMDPVSFSLDAKPTLKIERAPMAYIFKPTIKLGHPKDRLKNFTLTVDGTVLATNVTRFPGFVSGLNAGNHTIEIGFNTYMGVTSSKTVQVTVVENQPPVCTLTSKPVLKSTVAVVMANFLMLMENSKV